jgi:hypothetical protein
MVSEMVQRSASASGSRAWAATPAASVPAAPGVVDQDVQRTFVRIDQSVDRAPVEQVQLHRSDRGLACAGAKISG